MRKIDEIKNIAVIGAGTMGSGIALVFAHRGYEVRLVDISQESLDKAKSVIQTSLNTLVEFGILNREEIDPTLGHIFFTRSQKEAASDADLVLEAIVEDYGAKKELFEQLNEICSSDTVFTSNTSSLNIFDLVPSSRLPNTVIAHWFAPPHIIPLVEVIRGSKTADDTINLIVILLKKVGKTVVVMERFIPGFIINRLLRSLGREIFFLLDNGYITPDQLDLAVKASLAPRMMILGVVQRYDYTGLDISAKNLENPDFLDPPIDNRPNSLFSLVEKGHLGVKTGRGFFDYGGRNLEEILKERDLNLLRTLKNTEFRLMENNELSVRETDLSSLCSNKTSS
jgi:3-hydroxybutyryl-CoA dehydrogenase